MTPIENLQSIISDPTSLPDDVEMAQQQLDRLASVGSANVQLAAVSQTEDPALAALLAALESAMRQGGGSGSAADVRRAVNEELSKRKITENDLSPDLLALINSQRKVSFTINKLY